MENVSDTLEYLDQAETLEYLDAELPRLRNEVRRVLNWASEDAGAIPDKELAEIVTTVGKQLAAATEALNRAMAAAKQARARFEQIAEQKNDRPPADKPPK